MAGRTKATLRPMLPSDVPQLTAIVWASIEILAEDDYDQDQRNAWSELANDEAAFTKRLSAGLTLVATSASVPAGFVTLKGAETIDMLYVAPESARQGVATLLCDAIETLAAARGAAKLTVDASDTARDFFAGRGYVATVRNMVPVDDQWLGNTSMERVLPKGQPS